MKPRLTQRQVFELSASAVAKVHMRGRRGAESVTVDEVEALVILTVDLGKDALSHTPEETTDEHARRA
ncbi:hypothetical protein [Pseudaestuariivita sp.]|uniref:hypothetical protein n=1 Tax=Pseudaestuariivita sp. TaxID=2211669 RepID=UPI0040589CD9